MKLGIKEFRERLSEVAHGDQPVVVTHHGKVLGRFIPERRASACIDTSEWMRRMSERRERWKAATPDWRERLGAFGLDEDGEPIER